MSLPATKDINGAPIVFELYRGDTFRRTLTFLTDDLPLALPAAAWSAEVRTEAGALLGSFTVDASGAASGVLVLSMTAAVTETMSDGVFDLQVVSGDTTTYLRGRVTVAEDVTA